MDSPTNISWTPCLKPGFEHCSDDQIDALNQYAAAVLESMGGASTFETSGNGAFIHTCLMHCGGQGAGWTNYLLKTTSMADATTTWWESPNSTPATPNLYLPGCQLSKTSPKQCNPSCL